IIDCVEAALLLPAEEGYRLERAAFEDLLATPESAALRHAFLAERRAGKLAETEDVRPREIATVGVVGGGLMGAGIAEILLAAGYRVTVVERDADALAAGYARVSAALDRAVERGRLTAEARAAQWARLSGAMDPGALFAADLVIEAVVEDEAVKCELF